MLISIRITITVCVRVDTQYYNYCVKKISVKSPKNVLEIAQELGACEFVRYIKMNGLYDMLTNGGPYTIFIPTDKAFAVSLLTIKQRKLINIYFLFLRSFFFSSL